MSFSVGFGLGNGNGESEVSGKLRLFYECCSVCSSPPHPFCVVIVVCILEIVKLFPGRGRLFCIVCNCVV